MGQPFIDENCGLDEEEMKSEKIMRRHRCDPNKNLAQLLKDKKKAKRKAKQAKYLAKWSKIINKYQLGKESDEKPKDSFIKAGNK